MESRRFLFTRVVSAKLEEIPAPLIQFSVRFIGRLIRVTISIHDSNLIAVRFGIVGRHKKVLRARTESRWLKLSWVGSYPCRNRRIRRRRIPPKYDKFNGCEASSGARDGRVDVIQGFLNVPLMAAITVPWSGHAGRF